MKVTEHEEPISGATPEVKALTEALSAPFEAKDVHFKPGKISGSRALALVYVDARAIQRCLERRQEVRRFFYAVSVYTKAFAQADEIGVGEVEPESCQLHLVLSDNRGKWKSCCHITLSWLWPRTPDNFGRTLVEQFEADGAAKFPRPVRRSRTRDFDETTTGLVEHGSG